MKAWVNRNQAEWHVDNVEVSGNKITMVMHSHLDEPGMSTTEKSKLLSVVDLVRKRVLATLAEFKSIKGVEK